MITKFQLENAKGDGHVEGGNLITIDFKATGELQARFDVPTAVNMNITRAKLNT
jgi:hypothetical protein